MAEEGSVVIGGPTAANPHNSDRWNRRMHNLYAGTRLERQELNGELLTDNPGALWTEELLERCRLNPLPAGERDRFAKRTRVRARGTWRALRHALTRPPLRGSLQHQVRTSPGCPQPVRGTGGLMLPWRERGFRLSPASLGGFAALRETKFYRCCETGRWKDGFTQSRKAAKPQSRKEARAANALCPVAAKRSPLPQSSPRKHGAGRSARASTRPPQAFRRPGGNRRGLSPTA